MSVTPSRNIRIPDNEWEAAKKAAAERHETISIVVRRALREYASGPAHKDWCAAVLHEDCCPKACDCRRAYVEEER